MSRTERQREHFNKVAAVYEAARRDANHLLLKELMWDELLGGRYELRVPGLAVLEAMCGFADGKDILERHLGVMVAYEGFDYSDEVVTKVRATRPELNVWQENVESFTIRRPYDLVLVIGGLHHVPHVVEPVIAHLVQAVRPGGWFINFEPTHGNRLAQVVREGIYKRNRLFDEETERAFPVQEYLDLLAGAGLRPVDVMYPGLLSYILYYNPDAFPWLNVGGGSLVRLLFRLDRPLMRRWLGRKLSFATLGLWRKEA
jgi:SAM-dependent methyltransferase